MPQFLNPLIGKGSPAGPSMPRGAGEDVAGGFASRRMTGRKNPDGSKPHGKFGNVSKSKKAYTGTLAGIGRHNGVIFRRGPGGPSRFAPSVQLPRRNSISAGGVQFGSSSARPSLMTRIGHKLRSSAAAIGF